MTDQPALPPDLRYERFAPAPALAGHVEHFWIVEATPGATPRREILVPGGRPMILVCLGNPGTRIGIGDGRRTLNDSAMVGIETEPVILEQAGVSRYLAAQLAPFGLAAFRNGPLADAREAFDPGPAVRAAEFGEAAVRALEAVLIARFSPIGSQRLARLGAAVAAIEAAAGDIEVDRLCAGIGVSYDRLYRDFRACVGITPKQLIAITRYQALVGGLLAARPGEGLAQLALMQGYYDQAHANRDFRRFTGVTPGTFRARLNGIARLMHQS